MTLQYRDLYIEESLKSHFLFNFFYYYYLNYNESTLSSKQYIPHGIKNNYLVQNNEYCCICKSPDKIIVCDSSSRESPLSLCTEREWGFFCFC